MKKVNILVLLLFMTIALFAGSKIIKLNEEIKNSAFIGLVKVIKYNYSVFNSKPNTKFKFIESVEMRFISNDSLILSKISDADKPNSIFDTINYYTKYPFTGFWPNTGDTVLVILDSLNNISVFGKSQDTLFRFWSPYMTGSLAAFVISDNTIPLLDKSLFVVWPSGKRTCVDGCFMKKDFFIDPKSLKNTIK